MGQVCNLPLQGSPKRSLDSHQRQVANLPHVVMSTPALHDSPADRQNPPEEANGHPTVYFDGVCGLCNRVVDFVISRDPRGVFRFAPLQGNTAHRRLPADDLDSLETLVVTTGAGTFRRSAAVVRILWRLAPHWRLLGGLLWLIPLPLRDLGYRIVSKSRYRLFGKRETCRLPTEEERSRFLP